MSLDKSPMLLYFTHVLEILEIEKENLSTKNRVFKWKYTMHVQIQQNDDKSIWSQYRHLFIVFDRGCKSAGVCEINKKREIKTCLKIWWDSCDAAITATTRLNQYSAVKTTRAKDIETIFFLVFNSLPSRFECAVRDSLLLWRWRRRQRLRRRWWEMMKNQTEVLAGTTTTDEQQQQQQQQAMHNNNKPHTKRYESRIHISYVL